MRSKPQRSAATSKAAQAARPRLITDIALVGLLALAAGVQAGCGDRAVVAQGDGGGRVQDAVRPALDLNRKPDSRRVLPVDQGTRDTAPWPVDATMASDAGHLCAPPGGLSSCYDAFKAALVKCHCMNGLPWSTCVAGQLATAGPYGAALQDLAGCVQQKCKLCENGGDAVLWGCADKLCSPQALCCYGLIK